MRKFKLKHPEQSEADLKKQVLDYLQLLENQQKCIFIRNNSFVGRIQRPDKSWGWIQNGKKGSPDVFLFLKGKCIGLELKTRYGACSALQKEFRDKFTLLGFDYHVIRSLDELIAVLKKHGII